MKSLSLIIILLSSVVSKSISKDIRLSFPLHSIRQITSIGECENFTWVGTNIGLYRIDKKNGKTNFFNQRNSKLPSNHVTSICCSTTGHTYIGTINGLWLWDNYSFLTINTENTKLPCNYITSIIEDINKTIWIGTYDKGLIKCTGRDIKPYKSQLAEVKYKEISNLLIDATGDLWVEFSCGVHACLQDGIWVERHRDQLIRLPQSNIIVPPLPESSKN